jgi:ferredoxin-NADP reductase
LIDPPETDDEGNTRAFSLASAPFESELMIGIRMRDTAFKRLLRRGSLGMSLKVEGPSGSFVLHRKVEKPAVFLAGGIGITPFLSIIRQATHENAAHQLYLFYSNRRPEDTAFLEILAQTAKQNPNFHLIATMTEMEKSRRKWQGETSFSNGEMLRKHLPSLQGPIYYIAGPPRSPGCGACSPKLAWTKTTFVPRSFPDTENQDTEVENERVRSTFGVSHSLRLPTGYGCGAFG